jgi:hypothetical protein
LGCRRKIARIFPRRNSTEWRLTVEIGKEVRIKKRKVDSPLNGKIGTIEAENPDVPLPQPGTKATAPGNQLVF